MLALLVCVTGPSTRYLPPITVPGARWALGMAMARHDNPGGQPDGVLSAAMSPMNPADYPLSRLADRVGTPFFFHDGAVLRARLAQLAALSDVPGVRARYAMKANSLRPVLTAVREHDLWIDAVSGNEALRAMRAGFPGGNEPP